MERSQGQPCVLKMAKTDVATLTVILRDAFYQEVALHWRFRDTPGFARLYGYAEQPFATIVMKFYPFGSLLDYILQRKP